MSKLLDSGLVQISKKASGPSSSNISQIGISKLEQVPLSRRSFLKVLGATSATALTACAKDAAEKVIPYSKGENESIPGVATWYSSTCGECSTGCGIKVRTREGRAVKVEGNSAHPINRGGLCGLGQASLQDLYDPDRIRQPMKRVVSDSGKSVFKPITWDEAYAEIATALAKSKEGGSETAFISESLGGGALDMLAKAWSSALGAEHVVYNPLEASSWAQATELVFGKRGLPQLNFESPDVVLNFGADFLETWISPVEYAKSWANGRRKAKPTRVIHIEPRASLTAANADHWFLSKAGTESALAFGILRAVIDAGKVGALSAAQVSKLKEVTSSYSIDTVSLLSGIEKRKINQIVDFLVQSKSSLVIAGGTLAMSENGLALCLAAQLLNVVLGNVGTSFDVSKLRIAESSVSKLETLIKKMSDKKVGVLFVHKANPAFSLPADFNFKYAVKYVPLVVSFSSQLDETAKNAHLLLPAHTGLESWGDINPLPGVYSLLQPSMTPVFDSSLIGDQLLKIAKAAGQKIIFDGVEVAADADFVSLLKARWKKLHATKGPSLKSFDDFWKESLERGGYYFDEKTEGNPAFVGIPDSIVSIVQAYKQFGDKGAEGSEYVLYPFTSVKGFDGRAANRPWLQELPDPVSQVVWDSWIEIHPETAKKLSVEKGDLLTVRNHFGEVNLPAYITPYVGVGVVAIPLGQGHTEYGRYATESSAGGNVFDLISAVKSADGEGVALFSTKVDVKRARGSTHLVKAQKQDDQNEREIARTSFITAAGLVTTPHKHTHFHHYLGEKDPGGHGDDSVHAKDGHAKDSPANDSHSTSPDAHGKTPALKASSEQHASPEHHEVKQFYKQRDFPIYKWGMSIDLNACTGCSACVVACHAENNVPVVGKDQVSKGRRMSWIQITRYHDGSSEDLQVSFLPMTCQHCGNAPCEPVCPVYATYHNEEGLNAMVYNRCVGTRYCANNCTYKVRRFNWYEHDFPTPLNFQLNPDVTKRTAGVMEKCTFCVQRIVETKDAAKDLGRLVKDGEVQPACVQSCPTEALVFGNLNDPESKVSKTHKDARSYKILDYHLNTQPSVGYLDRIRYEKI